MPVPPRSSDPANIAILPSASASGQPHVSPDKRARVFDEEAHLFLRIRSPADPSHRSSITVHLPIAMSLTPRRNKKEADPKMIGLWKIGRTIGKGSCGMAKLTVPIPTY